MQKKENDKKNASKELIHKNILYLCRMTKTIKSDLVL